MTLKTKLIGIAVFIGLIVFLTADFFYFTPLFAQASTTMFNLEPSAPVFALAFGLLATTVIATIFNLNK